MNRALSARKDKLVIGAASCPVSLPFGFLFSYFFGNVAPWLAPFFWQIHIWCNESPPDSANAQRPEQMLIRPVRRHGTRDLSGHHQPVFLVDMLDGRRACLYDLTC